MGLQAVAGVLCNFQPGLGSISSTAIYRTLYSPTVNRGLLSFSVQAFSAPYAEKGHHIGVDEICLDHRLTGRLRTLL